MFRTSMLGFALISFIALPAPAEDVPLENCDRLVVVRAAVGERLLLLLVDTGATSMLNSKSFAQGDRRNISITSWSATVETSALDVTIPDLAIGEHHMKNLKLPALDLTAIGAACGKKIDGVLGTDLLEQLGASVDFKDRVARLASDDATAKLQLEEFHRQTMPCEQAFNRGDEKAFADCLDPQFVLFTMGGDYHGREAAMEYFRQHYFRIVPLPQLVLTARAHHSIGDAIWIEYDLRITMESQVLEARGTALYRKTGDKWRMLNMNHSLRPPNNPCFRSGDDPTCKATAKSY